MVSVCVGGIRQHCHTVCCQGGENDLICLICYWNRFLGWQCFHCDSKMDFPLNK